MFPIIPFIIALVITVIAVIYIISPVDLLPDVIPVIGWTDDALVGIIALASWLYFLVRWGLSSLVYDITAASWQSYVIIAGLGLLLLWVITSVRGKGG